MKSGAGFNLTSVFVPNCISKYCQISSKHQPQNIGQISVLESWPNFSFSTKLSFIRFSSVATLTTVATSTSFQLAFLHTRISSARMGGTAAYDKFYFEITYLSDPSPIITLPCLSVSSKLDWCDSGMQKCQLKNCWCCYCCQCCYWRGTYYRQFGREAEVWSRYQRWIFCHFF